MQNKRIFLIVIDSLGIGGALDAADFGDEGANTLGSIVQSQEYDTPNLKKLGLFNIKGIDYKDGELSPLGAYGRLQEASKGKDTTIGHWEIAGVVSKNPLPTYPNGFPEEVLKPFRDATGKGVLCNLPYSGTDVIRDYGEEHMRTGDLIVYTSADSVWQIAAHEDVIPIKELYRYCEIARELLVGKHGVGRVIARPFVGTAPDFKRTANRRDYSLESPGKNMLDALISSGYETYGIGKISDIFAGKGIQHSQKTSSNKEGIEKTIAMLDTEFKGLCFVNLVDFDMVYGHRNNIDGYANAMTEFDVELKTFMDGMQEQDILMLTADHGCDPGFPGTDHTREDVPIIVYGQSVKENVDLNVRSTFADIAATILDIMEIDHDTDGTSFKGSIMR